MLCVAALALCALGLREQTGSVGRILGDNLSDLFGFTAALVPLLGAVVGVWLLRGEPLARRAAELAGYALLFLGVLALLGALPDSLAPRCAGLIGTWIAARSVAAVGLPGTVLFAGALTVVSLWLLRRDEVVRWAASVPWRSVVGLAALGRNAAAGLARWVDRQRLTRRTIRASAPLLRPTPERVEREPAEETSVFAASARPKPLEAPTTLASAEPVGPPLAPGVDDSSGDETPAPPRPRRRKAATAGGGWSLPPSSLLAVDATRPDAGVLEQFVRDQARIIEQTLQAFHVEGKIVSVTSGARVILFEWQPAPGVKASRLENLADDLALALKAERVRVVLPLPGKGTIGIEVPHPSPAGVTLGSVFSAHADPAAAGDLPLFLGRALTGEALVADLAQMPHLLIAGTTGSGKSVCIHTILLSLMMTRTPDQLRLLLIDPKRVEMIAYRGTPHLLFEVVSDAKRAVATLRWVVSVMDARYRLLARHGCRDLQVFNRAVTAGEAAPDEEERREAVTTPAGLPWIVVAVDELADLMSVKAREVEDALQRIAQMARGVGIHLVVATQRPSVDVLTGVIKANLPSRLSFQVATRIDSRTILDSGGAEQLLGRGDMLFAPAGSPGPARAQGAFVSPGEVSAVLAHWGAQGAPEYAAERSEADSGGGEGEGAEGDDPLYDEAVNLVVRTNEASVSMLQRRLSIGFARAGRLIDIMERRGIVGPKQGSKSREIVSRDASAGSGSAGGDT
ncbi:MAG: DNA translocase FtsK 4TM domain-containing protein [bacterium]